MHEDAVRLADGLAFPEGPCFAPDGRLWWVEIEGGCLGVRDRVGQIVRVDVGGRPNGATCDARGRLWFTDQGQNSIRCHDPATGTTETVCDQCGGVDLGKPNDLAFDAAGNLVFSCSNDARKEPVGYVCCMAPDGAVTRIAERLYFPNGLAFSADGQQLVVAETYRQRLLAGTWDPTTRQWTDMRVLANVRGPVGPDGMAFDDQGRLHVAIFGQGVVAVLDADGHHLGPLTVPGDLPTNLAFDPAGDLGLVVTEVVTGALWSLPALRSASMLHWGSVP